MKKIITITLDSDLTDTHADFIKNLRLNSLTGETAVVREAAWGVLGSAAASGEITITEQRGWVAGWNVPGYLPESEPQQFDTWKEACDYLIEQINEWHRDCVSEAADKDAERWGLKRTNAALSVLHCALPDEPTWAQCGKYAWWIAQEQ